MHINNNAKRKSDSAQPKIKEVLVSERVVQQNRTGGVKYIMQNETTTVHVSPIRLWQALCGGVQLPQGQYQHVIHCVACEKLATQIGDALDDIEEALRRNHIGVPGGSQSTSRLN